MISNINALAPQKDKKEFALIVECVYNILIVRNLQTTTKGNIMKREIIRGKFERTKQRIGVMPTRREDSSKKVSIRHDIARLAVEEVNEFLSGEKVEDTVEAHSDYLLYIPDGSEYDAQEELAEHDSPWDDMSWAFEDDYVPFADDYPWTM